MLVFLSPGQLAVVNRTALYFGNALGNSEVRSMFRESAGGVSIGLAYSEQGQNFIVRAFVPEAASDHTIDDLCGRLIAQLAVSCASVLNRPARWAA